MKTLLTTIGSATRDIFLIPERVELIDNKENLTCQRLMAFEYGAKLNAQYLKPLVGGTAINVAVGLRRLGIVVSVFCSIGNDSAGNSILERLKKEGVSTNLINVSRKGRTDSSLVILDPKTRDRTIFVKKEKRRGLKNDYDLIKSPCIYISSIKHNWERKFKQIEELVKKEKKRLFFTPGIKQVQAGLSKLKRFLKNVEIIFLNLDEAIEISEVDKNQIEEALKKGESEQALLLSKKIVLFGPKMVVITLGNKGVYVYNKEMDDKIYFRKSIKTKEADVTGAGDAFASGFLASYLLGKDMRECTYNGIKNASSVIKRIGTIKGLMKEEQLFKS